MAHIIKCTHCGASLKTANPIAPGKKVKCPKCAKIFAVPAEEEEKKPVEVEDTGADEEKEGKDADEEESGAESKEKEKEPEKEEKEEAEKEEEDEIGDDEQEGKVKDDDEPDAEEDEVEKDKEDEEKDVESDEDKPVKKTKVKQKRGGDDDQSAEPPKKGKGMLIGIAIGGLLLVCCCCSGLGTGGFFLYPRYFGAEPFHGLWTRSDERGVFISIEFHRGGRGHYLDPVADSADHKAGKKVPDAQQGNFKWTKVDDRTIELTMDNDANRKFWFGSDKGTVTFSATERDLILTAADSKTSHKFTRVKKQ